MSPPKIEEVEGVLPRGDWNGDCIEPTKEGNAALKKGREIKSKNRRRGFFGVAPPSSEQIESVGGKPVLLLWFGTFYKRMMSDPRMAVLFDTEDEEAYVSAAEHGKRLVLALLSRWTGDGEYHRSYHGGMFHRLSVSHQRAKSCPMRSSNCQHGQFTKDQRDSWLGHLYLAGQECEVPQTMVEGVTNHLATVIGVYGPFREAKPNEA